MLRLSHLLALAALACASLAACGTASDAPAPSSSVTAASPSATHATATPVAVSPDTPLADSSIYTVGGGWVDQTGAAFDIASLRGTPVVLAMVFTNCGYACPLTVQDAKSILRNLPDEGRGVRVVLVTLDPERDTPEALRGFAVTHALPANWTLLRGSDDDVRMLAALLGVRYRREANGEFAHSNLLTVLDAGGSVMHRQEGLGSDASQSVALLTAALDGRS